MNAAFEIVEECEALQKRNVRADQFIRLTGAKAQAGYPDLLRRIVVWMRKTSANRPADESAVAQQFTPSWV
jgi:hypothetical protein